MFKKHIWLIHQLSMLGICLLTMLMVHVLRCDINIINFWFGFLYATVLYIVDALFERYEKRLKRNALKD